MRNVPAAPPCGEQAAIDGSGRGHRGRFCRWRFCGQFYLFSTRISIKIMQADVSPPAKGVFCPDKHRLSDDLLEAAKVLVFLQTMETRYPRTTVEAARADWKDAWSAYAAHLREHEC